jgi:phosphoribosylaminoimidazole (AIR) synthetase
VVVPSERAADAVALLNEAGEQAWVAGRIESGSGDVVLAG